MEQVWFRPLVWLDYRLALIFTIILPIVLLIWSVLKRSEAIQQLLIIYCRVASLLIITLYLMIPSWPIAYFTGVAALILIPISLWFWVDLNDEIKDSRQTALKTVTTSWRWAVTIYCSLGVMVFIPFLSCGFAAGAVETPFCEVWLHAPWHYKNLIHPNINTGFLGFLGIIGLAGYILYFAYFLFFRLAKQGRSALDQ